MLFCLYTKNSRTWYVISVSLFSLSRLEEKARAKDVALKKSEEMLEEDAKRFDEFLRLNDKRAHAAMKQYVHRRLLVTDL